MKLTPLSVVARAPRSPLEARPPLTIVQVLPSSSPPVPFAVAYAEPAAPHLRAVVGTQRAQRARPLPRAHPLDDIGERTAARQTADVLQPVARALRILLRPPNVRSLFVNVVVGASRASEHNYIQFVRRTFAPRGKSPTEKRRY